MYYRIKLAWLTDTLCSVKCCLDKNMSYRREAIRNCDQFHEPELIQHEMPNPVGPFSFETKN